MDLISVCIPTFNRAPLVLEAVRSVIAQDYRPLEIVIGDDSDSDEAGHAVNALASASGVTICYRHHRQRLRQADNVNSLFDRARGDRCILLHDDDLLLPGAIGLMDQVWRSTPGIAAVFGKQIVISADGKNMSAATERLNRAHFRTEQQAIRALGAWESALVGQFPNDGYMIRTSVARKVRYRPRVEVGTDRWCDFDFGIRLAQDGATFRFVDDYTAAYRLTPASVRHTGLPVYLYAVLLSLGVPEDAGWAHRLALKRICSQVVTNLARLGEADLAWKVYCSVHYGFRRRFSLRGARDLALIMRAIISRPMSCSDDQQTEVGFVRGAMT